MLELGLERVKKSKSVQIKQISQYETNEKPLF